MNKETSTTDFIGELMLEQSAKIAAKIDNVIIEGLKLKGFCFKNKRELEKFVEARCGCRDDIDLRVKTYYVDNTPFLAYNYKTILDFHPMELDRENRMSIDCGTYLYL